MNIYPFRQHFANIIGLATFFSLAGLVTCHSTMAFTVDFQNTDFESDYANWNTTGDTSIQGTFQDIDPIGGSNQALVTTACPDTPFPDGECFDTQNTANPRQDDPNGNSTFNFSGSDQTDANGNNSPNNLQGFLGLNANSLNIAREGGTIPGFRTPKEGSAISQTFTVEDAPFVLSFDWNYLSNDGTKDVFGNQDYSFLTLYSTDSDLNSRKINILGDSTGEINTPIPTTQTDFEKVEGYKEYNSEALPPGTYTLGLGVVDVDGTGLSSGLLLDNFAIQEVPFDFSATTGLGIVAGIFGLSRFRRKFAKDKNSSN